MTVHRSRVEFDNSAEVKVSGKVGGRSVEYTGFVSGINVEVDDGIDDQSFYSKWMTREWCPEHTTYSFTLENVDGKALTVKMGKKPIKKTARVYGPEKASNTAAIEACRQECGAPASATHYFHGDDIVFIWEEEV